MFDVDLSISQLKEKLPALVSARATYVATLNMFESMGLSTRGYDSLPSLTRQFEELLELHFEEQDALLSKKYGTSLPVGIKMPKEHYLFQNSKEGTYKGIKSNLNSEVYAIDKLSSCHGKVIALELVIDKLPWQKYKVIYDDLCFSIKKRSQIFAATALAKFFRLTSVRTNHTYQRGRFVLNDSSLCSSHEWQSKVDEIKKLMPAIRNLEEETLVELGPGINEFSEALLNASSTGIGISSRSCFGRHHAVEVHYYISKIQYRLNQEAFNALQSFIVMHCNDNIINAVMDIAELEEAA